MRAIKDSLIRSRSGALIAITSFTTVATGVLLISVPLELRHMHAAPAEIGVTLSMLGFGMFAFEWLWGMAADRFGYRAPLVLSQVLYAACIALLAAATTVPAIAVAYFFGSGAMVAVGPIVRSYVGTSLQPRLRATGLALLSTQWLVAESIGSGAGGQLIDRMPIHSVIVGAAFLPLASAALALWIFRGYSHAERLSAWSRDEEGGAAGQDAGRAARILAVTAAIVLLVQVGTGGEIALLPLLVTGKLGLSASSAGGALLVVGLVGGALLVPGGAASDRWGRRPTMVIGGIVSAAGYVVYTMAGGLGVVLIGAVVRAAGTSLLWPAATAWISESVPRRSHALFMGLFGEFENVGFTLGPAIGGLVWSASGISSAFYLYAAAAVAASAVAVFAVRGGHAVQQATVLAQDLEGEPS